MTAVTPGTSSVGDQACRAETYSFEYNLSMTRHKFAPSLLITVGSFLQAQDLKPVVPGVVWERVPKPETVGYSTPKLEALRYWLKTQVTKGMVVVVGGRVLFEYGDVEYVSKIASERKSVLAMLFGNYVASGKVNLRSTVKEMGLDDLHGFLPIEEHATLEMLLTARSGIYHPAGETDVADEGPRRGSQYPGGFFYYNAWDFNAAGTAFEKMTGKNIYDALESDLAKPLGMQDFDRKGRRNILRMGRETEPCKVESSHPEYAMYLSTRDMARGLVDAPRQYLTVLPQLDLVVSHKVEIEGDAAESMTELEYSTILQNGDCRGMPRALP